MEHIGASHIKGKGARRGRRINHPTVSSGSPTPSSSSSASASSLLSDGPTDVHSQRHDGDARDVIGEIEPIGMAEVKSKAKVKSKSKTDRAYNDALEGYNEPLCTNFTDAWDPERPLTSNTLLWDPLQGICQELTDDRAMYTECTSDDKSVDNWKSHRLLVAQEKGSNFFGCSDKSEDPGKTNNWRSCAIACRNKGNFHGAYDFMAANCKCKSEDRGCTRSQDKKWITFQNINERKGAKFDLKTCGTCKLSSRAWGEWTLDKRDEYSHERWIMLRDSGIPPCGERLLWVSQRFVTYPPYPGDTCPQTLKEKVTSEPCPIDCEHSPDWSQWTECSATCSISPGDVVKTRTRDIVVEPQYGGKECEPQSILQTEPCKDVERCSLDCLLTEWVEWSDCTKECGGGTRERGREVESDPSFGGKECDEFFEDGEDWTLPGAKTTKQTEACNTASCVIDCEVGGWGWWSLCSATCGDDGTQTRHRIIIVPAQNGGKCEEELEQSRACADNAPCEYDGRKTESSPVCDLMSVKSADKLLRVVDEDRQACTCPSEMAPCTADEAMESVSLWIQAKEDDCKANPNSRSIATDFNNSWCGFVPTTFLPRSFIYDPEEYNVTNGCLHKFDTLFCMDPTRCTFSAWSEWSPCDKPCGSGGSTARSRAVIPGFACPDSVPLLEKKDCTNENCSGGSMLQLVQPHFLQPHSQGPIESLDSIHPSHSIELSLNSSLAVVPSSHSLLLETQSLTSSTTAVCFITYPNDDASFDEAHSSCACGSRQPTFGGGVDNDGDDATEGGFGQGDEGGEESGIKQLNPDHLQPCTVEEAFKSRHFWWPKLLHTCLRQRWGSGVHSSKTVVLGDIVATTRDTNFVGCRFIAPQPGVIKERVTVNEGFSPLWGQGIAELRKVLRLGDEMTMGSMCDMGGNKEATNKRTFVLCRTKDKAGGSEVTE
eukprot:GHVN01082490.1.p1 GENE.GHVN01082490.1~~GHVN01082490.1.p1  ORF type:complete len:1036 (+),score=191.36 GHVN01082490.1:290-3109(+)